MCVGGRGRASIHLEGAGGGMMVVMVCVGAWVAGGGGAMQRGAHTEQWDCWWCITWMVIGGGADGR